MISGAVGAVTGEVLAEAFKPVEQLRSEIYAEHPHYDTLSKTDQWSIIQRKTDTHRKAWKFLSAFAGGLVGGNANVAYQAADTAIENNFIVSAIMKFIGKFVFKESGKKAGKEIAKESLKKNSQMLGKQGEEAVRKVYNIGEKNKELFINGKKRFPDGLSTTLKTISEVKNVKTQALTKQLKDYLFYAEKKSLQFHLYTRPDTILTKPLQKLVDAGRIIRFEIPK